MKKTTPLMNRRTAGATLIGLGGGLLAARPLLAGRPRVRGDGRAVPNSTFYDAEGKFLESVAKSTYLDFMERVGYPVSDTVRQNFWVADFSRGRFAEIGLGGSFWVNSKDWNYASIEIFLLPWQMVPEHWHIAIEADGVAPKMESWIVRFGTAFACGEGEPTANPQSRLPPGETTHVTARNETVLQVGEVAGIVRPLEKHWLQAGPKGAIVTEVSTFHTGDAVRFTSPDAKL